MTENQIIIDKLNRIEANTAAAKADTAALRTAIEKAQGLLDAVSDAYGKQTAEYQSIVAELKSAPATQDEANHRSLKKAAQAKLAKFCDVGL